MADLTNREPGWAANPLYARAVGHFEAEEWEEAISLFSRLSAEYPDDQELKRILADLRLKASVSGDEPTRAQMRMRRFGRPILLAMGVVALVALLSVVSYAIYTSWLVPARVGRERATLLRQMHELARGCLAAGDYARAADLYEEILSEVPDDATAAAGLERSHDLQELAIAYDRALELTQEERWDEALQAWESILAADPNFRDVKHWTAQVEEQQVVRSLFAEAELRFESEDWSGCIETLERLRAQSSDYRPDEMETLLVTSLLNLAEQWLGEAHDPAEVYSDVMELFDEASQVRAHGERVQTERAVAEAYSQGFAAFQEEAWERAVEELRFVYEYRQGYAAGRAVELLYQANIRCGEERAEAGDLQGGLACYRAASELPVDDTSEARSRYDGLLPILTATPTPRLPAPTPTRTLAPQPPTPTATLSPYSFVYVPGSAQPLTRQGCPAPSIEGRVVDAAGRGLGGVWVRLEWWGHYQDKITEPDGKFGFAPLGVENFGNPVPFSLQVIRSPSSPAPLSPSVRLDFPGCSSSTDYHDGFINATFKAVL